MVGCEEVVVTLATLVILRWFRDRRRAPSSTTGVAAELLPQPPDSRPGAHAEHSVATAELSHVTHLCNAPAWWFRDGRGAPSSTSGEAAAVEPVHDQGAEELGLLVRESVPGGVEDRERGRVALEECHGG